MTDTIRSFPGGFYYRTRNRQDSVEIGGQAVVDIYGKPIRVNRRVCARIVKKLRAKSKSPDPNLKQK